VPYSRNFYVSELLQSQFLQNRSFSRITGSVFRAVAYVYRQIWLLIHLTCFQIVVLFQDKQLDNVNVLGDSK
jgi:hypothetical protein